VFQAADTQSLGQKHKFFLESDTLFLNNLL
jgi:hypothetical protein